MFYSLTGKIVYADAFSVAIECGGVAFRVFSSLNTLQKIARLGDTATVYTYLSVREDAMELYGFSDQTELDYFKMLLDVNGVGAKVAIAILSTFSPDDLSFSIASGDAKRITSAPGVGPKLAQRIVLELKDKMSKLVPDKVSSGSFIQNVIADGSGNKSEAVSALISLGYSQTEASAAVSTLDPSDSVEMLIKQALRYLMRG